MPGMPNAAQRIRGSRVLRMHGDIPEDGQDEADAERGLTKRELNELPIYEFKAPQDGADVKDEDKQCSICMSNFMPEVKVGSRKPIKPPMLRRLKCFHAFHQKCIDEWLKQKSICPLCKASQRSN